MELAKATIALAVEQGRERFWFLLRAAMIVFVPLGLLGALDQGIEISTEDPMLLGHLATAFAITTAALLGEMFYAGAVASAVARPHEFEPTLSWVFRHTNWWVILAIDILFTLAVTVGLLALVLPALFVYARWVLSATIADIDGTGVRAAFATSAALSKGHRVVITTVLIGVLALSSLLEAVLRLLVELLAGTGFVADWIGASISDIMLSPLFALLCAAFVLELRGRRDGAARA